MGGHLASRRRGGGPGPGTTRILVDRLWPRGIAKDSAPFEGWWKQVAPTTELRKWYGHEPERFAEFARRYRQELEEGPALARPPPALGPDS